MSQIAIVDDEAKTFDRYDFDYKTKSELDEGETAGDVFVYPLLTAEEKTMFGDGFMATLN